MQTYAETAWRGKQPFSYEFSVQPAHPDRHSIPTNKGWKIIVNLCVGLLSIGMLACVVVFSIVAFGSGLKGSVMIDDPFFPSLYILILDIFLLNKLVQMDLRKEEQYKDQGYCRRASERLKSCHKLKILDFKCWAGTIFPTLSFQHTNLRPSRWRKSVHRYKNFKGISWDERELSYTHRNAFQENFLLLQILSWIFVLLGWPLIIMHLASLRLDEINILGYTIFFILTGGVATYPFFVKRKFHEFKGDKRYSLNRQTGMVTLYKNGEPLFTHPFIDFNCYFKETYINARSGWQYNLFLAYRIEDYPYDHIVDLTWPINFDRRESYLEIWETIKCYMNVSIPLPESLFLSSRRPFDPTTQQATEKNGNLPLVYESMKDLEYERLLRG